MMNTTDQRIIDLFHKANRAEIAALKIQGKRVEHDLDVVDRVKLRKCRYAAVSAREEANELLDRLKGRKKAVILPFRQG